jgi:hypothetical protein
MALAAWYLSQVGSVKNFVNPEWIPRCFSAMQESGQYRQSSENCLFSGPTHTGGLSKRGL